MTEVANIYPADIQKHLLHPKNRGDVAACRQIADRVCRGQIAESYIRHTFNSLKGGFVYKQEGVGIIAFCCWKVKSSMSIQGKETGELYVYLVCGLPMPFSVLDMMLYDLDRYCYQRGIQYITLEPANEGLRSYYKQKGFSPTYMPQRMAKEVATPVVFHSPRRASTQRRTTTAQLPRLEENSI